MKFKPGQSGNPGGRPKVLGEVQTLARQYTTEAIEALVAIMRNKQAPPAAVALASNSILDRGYGRPAQTIAASVNRQAPDEMSDAELLAIAAYGGSDDDEEADDSVPTSKTRMQ